LHKSNTFYLCPLKKQFNTFTKEINPECNPEKVQPIAPEYLVFPLNNQLLAG